MRQNRVLMLSQNIGQPVGFSSQAKGDGLQMREARRDSTLAFGSRLALIDGKLWSDVSF